MIYLKARQYVSRICHRENRDAGAQLCASNLRISPPSLDFQTSRYPHADTIVCLT